MSTGDKWLLIIGGLIIIAVVTGIWSTYINDPAGIGGKYRPNTTVTPVPESGVTEQQLDKAREAQADYIYQEIEKITPDLTRELDMSLRACRLGDYGNFVKHTSKAIEYIRRIAQLRGMSYDEYMTEGAPDALVNFMISLNRCAKIQFKY